MTSSDAESIRKRLDVVIALLLLIVEKDGAKLSSREQIRVLDDLGMRPVDIATVIGRKPTYINKELATLRKRGRA